MSGRGDISRRLQKVTLQPFWSLFEIQMSRPAAGG